MKFLHGLLPLVLASPLAWATPEPEIPDDLIEDLHIREELGVNEITAPSIQAIFETLDDVSPLKSSLAPREMPERMPLDRTQIAMEIGVLMAEGFISVQTGDTKKIQPLAAQLQRYGRALGAGDRLERHVASLLESAEKSDVETLKKELTATQRDIEAELISLRDSDLSHLISLGGWLRALEVASASVNEKFSDKRAIPLFREDIADYYEITLGGLHPDVSERQNIVAIRRLLSTLREMMTVGEEGKPTEDGVAETAEIASQLVTLMLARPE